MIVKQARIVAKNVKAVAAVKAGDRQVNYRIKGAKGLRLLVHPSGRKTWACRYQIGTGPERRERSFEIGNADHVSLAAACDRAAEIVRYAKQGIDPGTVRQEQRSAGTFNDLRDQWLAVKAREKKSERYLWDARNRLSQLPEHFTTKKGHDIKRVDVTAALEVIAKTGVTVGVNRIQALISAVLGWATNEGLLEGNAAQGLRKRFREEPRDRVMSDEEVLAFWRAMDEARASEAGKIAMRLCLVLGQRPKEICELRQCRLMLDSPAPMLTIEKSSAKNRTEHAVPLPSLAVNLLRQAIALVPSNEWVFPSPTGNGPIAPGALSRAMIRTRGSKGAPSMMPDVWLYDTKSTMATWLGDQGHLDQLVGLLLNHKSAKAGITGRHYNHSTYMTQKRVLIEQWARHLEEVLGMVQPPANQ